MPVFLLVAGTLLPPAVGTVAGCSDNVLTARSFATRAGYRIDANSELLAPGTANVTAGFPGGFPVSSSASRTAIGDSVGSRSLVAVFVLVLLFGRPLLAAFPSAALGALVIHAALRLVEVTGFRRIGAFRRNATRIPGLVVHRYDAPLCCADAGDVRRRAPAAVDESPTPAEWFPLDAEANVEIDITAAGAIEDLRADLVRRGVVFAMARVAQDLRVELAAAGLVDRVGADRIFPTPPTAVAAFHAGVR